MRLSGWNGQGEQVHREGPYRPFVLAPESRGPLRPPLGAGAGYGHQGNRISKALTVALGWWTGRESILPCGTVGATGGGWGGRF